MRSPAPQAGQAGFNSRTGDQSCARSPIGRGSRSRGGTVCVRVAPRAPFAGVAQSVEVRRSDRRQCGFESHRQYQAMGGDLERPPARSRKPTVPATAWRSTRPATRQHGARNSAGAERGLLSRRCLKGHGFRSPAAPPFRLHSSVAEQPRGKRPTLVRSQVRAPVCRQPRRVAPARDGEANRGQGGAGFTPAAAR